MQKNKIVGNRIVWNEATRNESIGFKFVFHHYRHKVAKPNTGITTLVDYIKKEFNIKLVLHAEYSYPGDYSYLEFSTPEELSFFLLRYADEKF